MSADTTTQPESTPTPEPLPPVTVTLELPGRLHSDYSRLTELDLYMSVDEALRQAVLTAWRYERGSFHTLRLDLGDADGETDQEPVPKEG